VASAVAPAAAPAPTSAPAAAEVKTAPVQRPTVAAKPPAVPAEEPGLLSSLLDNPYVLPGAGIIVALLAGLGFYRWRSRSRNESGETSFLESRLQPDSFFGASGGQRIDTRDASGVSSSMSYSLSQLDAIGDVDPVAEADVYLAYGRDLQAEEILKEAMRSSPERLAIRTKLLEVYAKRRDTKGYELLATQLYSLTNGDGDEWHKAQELGQQIDPENSLYKPGGRPAAVMAGGSAAVVEPLGASTMPQSVMPPGSTAFAASDVSEAGPGGGLDLDLDLVAAAKPPAAKLESTQPLQPAPGLPPIKGADAAKPSDSGSMDFDLGGISLDLGGSEARPSEQSGPDSTAPGVADPADPLARKLELAEEFRQIGDMEGARDLLEEVVAKASGPLKLRAQGLLDDLA
jgi:pilus assembly protein FimV